MNKSPLGLRAASLAIAFCLFTFSSVLYFSCNKKDKCDGVVCYNGTCVDGKCTCLVGFTGSSCETADAKKFVGIYSGVNPCTNGGSFKIDTSIGNQVFINVNVGTDTCAKNINLTGSVIGDSIRFPAQGFLDHCQNSYAFSADGFMRHDSLIMTLRYNYPGYQDTCVFAGIK